VSGLNLTVSANSANRRVSGEYARRRGQPLAEMEPPDARCLAAWPAARRAPSFTLPTLDGGIFSLIEHRNSPALVYFWASWCGHCRREAPVVQRVWVDYEQAGVVFVGVNVSDTESGARGFIQEFGWTFPVVRDETGDRRPALRPARDAHEIPPAPGRGRAVCVWARSERGDRRRGRTPNLTSERRSTG
jgi:thiol-disulfide isomerase/thioredoxin